MIRCCVDLACRLIELSKLLTLHHLLLDLTNSLSLSLSLSLCKTTSLVDSLEKQNDPIPPISSMQLSDPKKR
jgi:hypothetical protein